MVCYTIHLLMNRAYQKYVVKKFLDQILNIQRDTSALQETSCDYAVAYKSA